MIKDTGIFENFVFALRCCSSKVLSLPDDELEYVILEDLDIEYFSMFHESTLKYLLDVGLIDNDIYKDTLILWNKINGVITLEQYRKAEAFRNNPTWLEVYGLSDDILKKLDKEV